jgi:predicted PurR-regulated permease PerM
MINQTTFQESTIFRSTIFLVGLFALFAILYFTKVLLVPLIFALIIAILLQPIVKFFESKRFNRLLAIILTLFVTLIIIAALALFIISQISKFGDSWPIFVEKFSTIITETVAWASSSFDIDVAKIDEWISLQKSDIINSSSSSLGKTMLDFGSALVVLLLVPVYVFMILYYQPLLIEFSHKIAGSKNQNKVKGIIFEIKTVIQGYLIGLVFETLIVAVLNSIVLLSLGIEYAILLGIIGSLLNLIPYIGGLVGVALPMMIAIVTKDSAWYALYVLGLYYVIQIIDNNFIVPKIVASRVKINALFSIIAVIAGGALWGIAGMFLSIPILAIIKLIFDHIEPLKPYGFLLGDTMPTILNIKKIPFLKKAKV